MEEMVSFSHRTGVHVANANLTPDQVLALQSALESIRLLRRQHSSSMTAAGIGPGSRGRNRRRGRDFTGVTEAAYVAAEVDGLLHRAELVVGDSLSGWEHRAGLGIR